MLSGCLDRLRRRLTGPSGQQHLEPGVQVRAVGLGDAQQLPDHPERQRIGVSLDEIDRGAGAGAVELIEEVVGDVPHGLLQRGDPGRHEGPGYQPPQPGVVGRVDVEHVPRELRPGQALGHDIAILFERGEHVLGDAGVAQRLAGCVVAEHDPGRMTVGEAHPLHRAPGPGLGEVTERVVADRRLPAAPGGQGVSHRRPRAGSPCRAGRAGRCGRRRRCRRRPAVRR